MRQQKKHTSRLHVYRHTAAPNFLPSPYGIGDLGDEAYRFADFWKIRSASLAFSSRTDRIRRLSLSEFLGVCRSAFVNKPKTLRRTWTFNGTRFGRLSVYRQGKSKLRVTLLCVEDRNFAQGLRQLLPYRG